MPLGSHNVGGRRAIYIDALKSDTALTETEDVIILMEDRKRWSAAIHDFRVGVG